VGVAGEAEGVVVRLNASSVLSVGRSNRGLQLHDPLIGIHHAEIAWRRGAYWLTDLGSPSGTLVEDRRVEDNTVLLEAGVSIRMGDCEFVLERRNRITPLEYVAILGPLSIAALVVLVNVFFRGHTSHAPSVTWQEPIARGDLVEASRQLPVPRTFIRRFGIDLDDLRIRRVTDFDLNGRDEVWLRHNGYEHPITFDEKGAWVLLGKLPIDCTDIPDDGGDLPLVQCGPVLHDVVDGQYRPVRQEGAVVWFKPTWSDGATKVGSPPDAAEPPEVERALPGEAVFDPNAANQPQRVMFAREMRLRSFLRDRGVREPIHYLICEDAFPGVRAQVLTESGKVVRLGKGCLRDVGVSRPGIGRPTAVAFTASGHRALIDDIATFYSGNSDRAFLDPQYAQFVDLVDQDTGPLLRAVRVWFRGSAGGGHDAVAGEARLGVGNSLIPSGVGPKPAQLAVTATIVSAGRARLDPPGCTLLEVSTKPWECGLTSGCFSSNQFMTVVDVGCGEPRILLEVPYTGGLVQGGDDRIELRAVVANAELRDRTSVLGARLSYRMIVPDDEENSAQW